MGEEQRRYVSYLLRIWQAREGEQVAWRCSLENSITGEIRGFTTLDEMNSYLASTTEMLASRKATKKQGDARERR